MALETIWFRPMLNREDRRVSDETLRRYDLNILEYERRLDAARRGFALKYFQYAALLYSEYVLDALSSDPESLIRSVNTFLDAHRRESTQLATLEPVVASDLRRSAFFMATGSGKTLLLHCHLWQVLDYLEHGVHPDTLVRRADGRREFDNLLLITPTRGCHGSTWTSSPEA